MFDRLVVTTTSPSEHGRKGYYLISSVAMCLALGAALVISIFSIDLSLGNQNFEMIELVAPIEQPETEPEPPTIEEPEPQQEVASVATPAKLPTRQINMARLDETPPSVPKTVSTTRNTQKERPKSGYFTIGKFDTAPVVGRTSGRSNVGAVNGGTIAGLSKGVESVAKVEENDAPPPPRVKKPEPPVKKRPAIRSLGVINGKAVSLPKPNYPAAAKAMRAQGRVSVRVLIDENGRVVSVDAISGHPLLRNGAEEAARRARFTPTLLSGAPVKISGTIIYNFST